MLAQLASEEGHGADKRRQQALRHAVQAKLPRGAMAAADTRHVSWIKAPKEELKQVYTPALTRAAELSAIGIGDVDRAGSPANDSKLPRVMRSTAASRRMVHPAVRASVDPSGNEAAEEGSGGSWQGGKGIDSNAQLDALAASSGGRIEARAASTPPPVPGLMQASVLSPPPTGLLLRDLNLDTSGYHKQRDSPDGSGHIET